MRKHLALVLVLVFLAGCSADSSGKFNAAGCMEANEMRFDLAAQQFKLASENGDPDAVRAADISNRIWYLMTYTPADETYGQFQARLDEVSSLEKRIKSYCKG